MWNEAAWFPLLALAVTVVFLIAVAGILQEIMATVPRRTVHAIAGLLIASLAVAAVTSYAIALLAPGSDQPMPDCVGAPYEVCQ